MPNPDFRQIRTFFAFARSFEAVLQRFECSRGRRRVGPRELADLGRFVVFCDSGVPCLKNHTLAGGVVSTPLLRNFFTNYFSLFATLVPSFSALMCVLSDCRKQADLFIFQRHQLLGFWLARAYSVEHILSYCYGSFFFILKKINKFLHCLAHFTV